MSAVDPPSADEPLAAELALGLLEGAERREAEARLARDPAFAQSHARWLALLATLLAAGQETPGTAVWTAIEARLPANDSFPTGRATTGLRAWRAAAIVASAAAAVLGIVAVQRQSEPHPPVVVATRTLASPPLVAVLTAKTNPGVVTISYDSVSGRITAAPTGVAAGRRATELWVIPSGGKPRSLGVISADRPVWRAVPPARKADLGPGATLALSLEPAGGSPTGQPTGPVILTGKFVRT